MIRAIEANLNGKNIPDFNFYKADEMAKKGFRSH